MTQSSPRSLKSFWRGLTLRRIITSNQFIPQVDGFRFLALIAVIVPHIYLQLQGLPEGGTFAREFHFLFDDGGRGVFLFFTISGFILALPFARHHLLNGNKVNLRSYFRRRLTRLEPPYLIAMLSRFILLVVLKIGPFAVLLPHFLASIFYLHTIIYRLYPTINPPAWSLEVEVQFYLLAPLLTAVFLIRGKFRRRLLLVLAVLASGIGSTRWEMTHPEHYPLTLFFFLQYFLAGLFLADIYLIDDLRLPKAVWDVLGFAALTWIFTFRGPMTPVLLPFVAVLLYCAAFYGAVLRWVFSLRPLTLIGGMCYSIYLTHSTILTAMRPVAAKLERTSLPVSWQLPLIFALCFAGILAMGVPFFLLIERPCMDPSWPSKLKQRLRRA